MSTKEVQKKEDDATMKTAKSPAPPGTKSDVVNSAALDLKTAKSELLNLDLKTDQRSMNTAISVDANNNNKSSKENDKKEIDPFMAELYNTSDDDKIISGLRSKNSKRKLQREAERMERLAAAKSASKTSSSKSSKSATSSGMKTAKQIGKRSPGTSRVRRGEVDLKGKPTMLTFRVLKERQHIARCVLVLCNISDIDLHFTLKSNGNAIIATYGNGHIAPHAQIRIILTWTRTTGISDWKAEPQQKLLLATQFLDAKDTSKYEVTHTRLLGRIGHSKMCTLETPPVEQLLLDAVGPKSTEHASAEQPKDKGNNMGMAMADFINNLTDRGLCALIVILAVLALVACSERR